MKSIVLVCILLQASVLQAQNNIGIKYFGLSIHPKGEKENAALMPHKLDKNAVWVLNSGGVGSYEAFLLKDILSAKAALAIYADCAARTGGFFHLGLRAQILRSHKHRLSGGIGPTLVYRRNWLEMDSYVNRNRFKGERNDRWQYLFLWYGGEFEYKYSLSHKLDFAASFVPGYPDLMSLSVGLHYNGSGVKTIEEFYSCPPGVYLAFIQ